MISAQARALRRGSVLYHTQCSACHGPGVIGGGSAVPDLRYLDAGFPQIVPFGSADVLSVSSGPTVATASGVTWREFSAADSSSGELAYSRYGRLSVPGATTPIEQSYHFGYETPLAAIPALGSTELAHARIHPRRIRVPDHGT